MQDTRIYSDIEAFLLLALFSAVVLIVFRRSAMSSGSKTTIDALGAAVLSCGRTGFNGNNDHDSQNTVPDGGYRPFAIAMHSEPSGKRGDNPNDKGCCLQQGRSFFLKRTRHRGRRTG